MPTTSSGAPVARPRGRAVPAVLALFAVLTVAANLRPGATTLGPALQEISASLALSGSLAGVLAALPGIVFGAVGFVAVRIGARLGMSASLAAAAGLMAVGLLARATVHDGGLFLVLTVVAMSGMALGNVLVPAWIKLHAPLRATSLMTVYTMFLTLGGSVAALSTAPVTAVAGDLLGGEGWRWALGAWGAVALVPLAVWTAVVRRTGHDFPAFDDAGGRGGSLLRSPTAWALTLLFGVQSMNAYVQFAWMPQVLRDAGLSAGVAGSAVALTAGLGIVGALTMPTVISRARTLAPWMVLFGTATAAGYVGLLLAPADGVWLWAAILGVGGFAFPTVLALIPARSGDPHVTARLSGFVQPVGYVLAAIGPFAVGLLHDLTGDWSTVLILLACSGLVLMLAGLRVSLPVTVDDELGPRA